jgi:general stress protein 26
MTSRAPASTIDPVAELAELLADLRIAMLTTVGADGAFHCRPMAMQEATFDGELWFFTAQSTHKVEEIRAHPGVSLAFVSSRESLYVSVTGQAEVVIDGARMRELWRPAYKAWFPQGLDDPDLALLRVRVERAEYWRSHASATVVGGLIKAIATGQRAEVGEHRELRLRDR